MNRSEVKYNNTEIKMYTALFELLEIKDFSYLNNIEFYDSEQFKKALNTIHNIYVFDKKDKIDIEQIQETLNMLRFIFSDLVTAKKIVNEKKKESEMEM